MATKCDIGYIYALFYNGVPFYIGQTKWIKNRFRQHKCDFLRKDKLVYTFLRSVTTKDSFNKDIKMKPLKVVSVYDMDKEEMKYIKYCIEKQITIYNDCVKTISYRNVYGKKRLF